MGSNSSSLSHSNPNPSQADQPPLPAATKLEKSVQESSKEKETLEEGEKEEEKSVEESSEEKETLEEEEDGECGFCVFMKGGACRDVFIQWNDCVLEDDEKKDEVAIKCADKTVALMNCMQANPDYYGPILKAEKDIDDEFDLENQKDASQSSIEASDSGNLKEENTQIG